MSKKSSRSAFEWMASPEAVAEFDRWHGITMHITPKCEHDWTGPEVKIEHGSSVSCAKCGMLAIDDAMRS